VLPQLIKGPAEAQGFSLQPASSNEILMSSLLAVLNVPSLPTTGSVVVSDMSEVCIDLSSVPLDDVLGFDRSTVLTSGSMLGMSVSLFATPPA
jgi:hypothetical protein